MLKLEGLAPSPLHTDKRQVARKKATKTRKDSCYRKVKKQYKVFPSAYASGAIAKCRKKKAGKKKK